MRNNHIVTIDKVEHNIGDIIQFNNILFYNSLDDSLFFGKPYVYNCKVSAIVCEHYIAKKIHILKFKRRKNYIRRQGHRQLYTKIKVISINFF